jgi:hypothetical protein
MVCPRVKFTFTFTFIFLLYLHKKFWEELLSPPHLHASVQYASLLEITHYFCIQLLTQLLTSLVSIGVFIQHVEQYKVGIQSTVHPQGVFG